MIIQAQSHCVSLCLAHGYSTHHSHRHFTLVVAPPRFPSLPTMPTTTRNRNSVRRRRNDAASWRRSAAASDSVPPPPPAPPTPEKQREGSDLQTLLRRFWKVAAPYWSSDDKVQARMQLGGVFLLTLATTGISVGFSFLGRDFYNALANKDQEQFTKQLLYYLGAFAGGIPFYLKPGQCKYGATCKFNHPKDIQIPSATQENKSGETETDLKTEGTEVAVKPLDSFTPALLYNSKELPVRPGEADCPFYLKTGSCKYGATCWYNHPDRYDINPPVAAISYPLSAPAVAGFNIGVASPAAFTYQTLAQPTGQRWERALLFILSALDRLSVNTI